MNKYDVVVIGAGPGGYPCAIRLGQLNKKVMIVEEKLLGGLCLNWGCIPTKALSFAAELIDGFDKAKRMGFDLTYNGYDLDKVRNWKEMVVKRLRTGIEYLFKVNNVEWKKGRARIVEQHKIEIETENGKETVEADTIVIATGTEVISLPGLEFDHERIIDTDDALDLKEIPERLLVIGAGASGLEMATVYSRLGSTVTIVEMMNQILPGMEAELCEVLQKVIKKSGIELFLESQVSGFEIVEGRLEVSIKTLGEVRKATYDKILVSVGRRPSTSCFVGLDIELDSSGYVKTDAMLMTSKEGIYAIGDLTGPPLLAHKATKQGIIAAENIAGLTRDPGKYSIPSCVFTIPPLASVGMTEAEAITAGQKVKIGRFPYRALGKAISMGETEGFVKIIGNEHGKLLGVHILGAESPSLIGEAVIALDQGLDVEHIAGSIHPHPTLTEAMQEAAENFLNKAIHIANK